ncbi:unknown [Prevotella sp. CAG:487]|nr:unknown [Prevotella sp. CAG:487]
MSRFRVSPYLSLARLVLAACVHHLLHRRLELLVEAVHHIRPHHLALGNAVELLLHFSREVVVHYHREVVHKEVVDHHSYVGGQQLALVVARHLGLARCVDYESAQRVHRVWAFLTLLVALHHIVALLYGAYCGGICGRASDAQFLQFVYEARLSVSRRTLRITLRGGYLAPCEHASLRQFRQSVLSFFLTVVIVVSRFAVHFKESVELHNLSVCHELLLRSAHTYRRCGLLYERVSHLASRRALPYKVIQSAFLHCPVHRSVVHICGADGLMSLLRAF